MFDFSLERVTAQILRPRTKITWKVYTLTKKSGAGPGTFWPLSSG